MNAPTRLILPTAIGAAFAGGTCLGGAFVDLTPYVIIAGPKLQAQLEPQTWSKNTKMVKGAMSVYDGLANTNAMAEAGSPVAKEVRALRLGEFDDWYIPSRGELLLAYAANEGLAEDEAFDESWYWSSTQDADAGYAWIQDFDDGSQDWYRKGSHDLVRAFRRQVI